MSIKLMIASAALLLSTPAIAGANPFTNREEQIRLMSDWSKKLVTAKYLVKWCPDSGVAMSSKFPMLAPPNVLPRAEYTAFLERTMTETKNKLDKAQSEVGREKFCSWTIEFMQKNYAESSPITVNNY